VRVGDRDRRVLWGRSGNQCALCRRVLVEDRTEFDGESVVGEEAHIAAQSAGGPRAGQLAPAVDVDSYENLILLCRVHHKAVDDQPNHYTVERLREIKTEHEKGVKDRLTDVEYPSIHDPISGLLAMQALTTGAAVWQLIDGSEAYLLHPPSDSDVQEDAVDLADEFLQLCRDYGDVNGDISDQGMRAVREAKRELQGYISLLAGYGLLVFGTHQIRSVPGYNPPVTFRVAVITVIRAGEPGIAPVDQ
jgi:hypothetical protein